MAAEGCRRCLLDRALAVERVGLELPEELGGFRLRRRIGQGASGEVWQAFQPGPDREVALKIFLDPRLGGSADRPRFLAEAQALGRLDHPGIVPVFASGEDGGFLFIASRWMPGGTLAEKPPARTREERKDTVRIVAKVARAAAHAHRHGLVHRDIKPANILLDAAGEPYLADFGIALAAGHQESGSTSGTPAYMAPEQARGGAVTTAADVFSLGAVLSECLTGRRGGVDGLEADLAAICRRCLAVEPEDRYSGAEDLAADLERWLRGEPVAARPVAGPVRLLRWMKRRPGPAALAVVAGLSALAFAVLLATGSAALRKERNHAVAQEALARGNAGRAERTAADFRRHAYAADVYLAGRALDDGQLGVARAMLDRHVPAAGEDDLRGYEWHAFRARCRGQEAAVFEGHDAAVTALGFSPDGRCLASAGRDGRVIVRDLDSREVVLALPKDDAPRGAAEIPRMAALMARSPEIRASLLRGETTPDQVRMRGRPSNLGELTALAWSPDGKRLATASEGAFVRLWSFPGGELEAILPLSQGRHLAFSGDGSRLVTLRGYGPPHELWIHDVETLEPLWHRSDVEPAIALHGDRLAWMDRAESTMHLVSIPDPDAPAVTWAAGTGLSVLAFSRDGGRLHGMAADGRRPFVWDCATGKAHEAPDPSAGVIRALVAAPDGIISAGAGQTLGIQAAGSRSELRGHEDEILALAASPDGSWLASSGKDRSVRLWQVPAAADLPAAGGDHPAVRSHSPDGGSWLAETEDGRVFLGRVGGEVRRLGDDAPRRALAWTPDGRRAVTWQDLPEGLRVEWWSAEDGALLFEKPLAVKAPVPRLVAADGGHFAVTADKAAVEVFDLSSGERTGGLPAAKGNVVRLIVSPDGRQVALFRWPRTVQAGRVDGDWGRPFDLSVGTVGPILFSRDGCHLVSGNDQNRVAIHELPGGTRVHEFSGHREAVVSLALSPDGRTLASSSGDRTLRLWHLPTRRPLGVLERGEAMSYLGFDRKGRQLLAAPWNRPPRLLPE